MKILQSILMSLLICMMPYHASAQNPSKASPTAKTSATKQNQQDLHIPFAKIADKKSTLNHLENTLHRKTISLRQVGDCGGFFAENDGDVENVVTVGNIGINIMNNKAIVSSIVNIADDQTLQYNNMLINNYFPIEKLPTSQYEITRHLFKNSQLFGIERAKSQVGYNSMYMAREKKGDDLVYFYYFNQKLVALHLVSQC